MSRRKKPRNKTQADKRTLPAQTRPDRSDAGSRRAQPAPDPRIELAWNRVAVARRAFCVVAVLGFGGVIALARVSYAGHPKQPARPLSAPARFVRIVRKNLLQAGLVAPAQAPPGAATAVS